MQKMQFVSRNAANYKNSRIHLLIVVICSLINIPALFFLPVYFPFSAFIPQLLTAFGAQVSVLLGSAAVAVVGAVLAAVSLVPYILCFIFSKKRLGWMIAGLVLYALDTLFFFIACIPTLLLGDSVNPLEVIFHLLIIFFLSYGVFYGVKMRKEEKEAAARHTDGEEPDPLTMLNTEEENGATRMLEITRKKNFAACAVGLTCCVNGEPVCVLKNGKSDRFPVPCQGFELGVMLENGLSSEKLTVGPGEKDLSFTVVSKMGFSSARILIEQLSDNS